MAFVKDIDCTVNTPVVLGMEDSPIYGKGIELSPRVPGRKDSAHLKRFI